MKSWSRSTKVFLFFSIALILILFFSDQLFPPEGKIDTVSEKEANVRKESQFETSSEKNPSVDPLLTSESRDSVKAISTPDIWAANAARFVGEMESCFVFSLKDYPTQEVAKLEREKFLDLLQVYGQVAQRNEEFKEYHVELSSGRQRRLTFLEGTELRLFERSSDGDWVEVHLSEDMRVNPSPNAVANLVNEGVVKKEIIKESFYFTQGEEAMLQSQDEKVTDVSISNLEKNLVCSDLLTDKMSCECQETLTY